MGDIFELTITLDLRDELSADELAELRWHLGLGPRPEVLRIVPRFPYAYLDDDGVLVVEDLPRPLLGDHCEARRVGGALVSVLLRREDTWCGAWALTSRQEIHPNDFDLTGELLGWLAARAGDRHRESDGSVTLGWTRFLESCQVEPLVVRDGVVVWP
ncbi:hypothetical protein EH183_42755 [Streptomyces sp. CB01881]|uniref:hypothetical protein n=1 Tax=Streptomyces sp. CB01881 TaxID=2078691 RepID=UPI0011E0674C|nr:hypothetical protein [Streptomyces sp. CB01881]TYC66433.1 hypothetical protein EH183_42755 [Streptomyces sp. CB01881]